jgi:hypothetical protein
MSQNRDLTSRYAKKIEVKEILYCRTKNSFADTIQLILLGKSI